METMALQRQIMRRVYYAFALRLILNRHVLHLGLLAVSLAVLFKLVFVMAVIRNLFSVEVGNTHVFIFEAFRNADMPTLLVFAISVGIFISFMRKVGRYQSRGALRTA